MIAPPPDLDPTDLDQVLALLLHRRGCPLATDEHPDRAQRCETYTAQRPRHPDGTPGATVRIVSCLQCGSRLILDPDQET